MIEDVFYNNSGRLSLTTTFQMLVAESVGSRKGILIQNKGEDKITLAFTQEQLDADSGFDVNPNEIIYFDTVSPKNAIFAKSVVDGDVVEFLTKED